MNVTIEQVRALAGVEYDSANSAHGPLASMHEGWAVAREEMDETEDALAEAEYHMHNAWDAIRKDDSITAKTEMDAAYIAAIQIASEALQVAAVCKRFLDLHDFQ